MSGCYEHRQWNRNSNRELDDCRCTSNVCECQNCIRNRELKEKSFKAAKWIHDPIIFKRLVENGFSFDKDINEEEKGHLIQKICEENLVETMNIILEQKSSISLAEVMEYVKDDSLDIAKCFMKNGYAIQDHTDVKGLRVPLLVALKRNLNNVVKYLQDCGVYPNKHTMRGAGQTMDENLIARTLAMRSEPYDCSLCYLHVLVGYLEALDMTNDKALDETMGDKMLKVFKHIIPHIAVGLNISTLIVAKKKQPSQNNDDKTLTEYMINYVKENEEICIKILSIFMEHGLDINKCCMNSHNLLALCMKKGLCEKTVLYLLEKGFDVNSINNDKYRTPVFHLTLDMKLSPVGLNEETASETSLAMGSDGLTLKRKFDPWLFRGVDVNCTDSCGLNIFQKTFCTNSYDKVYEKEMMYLLCKSELDIEISHYMHYILIENFDFRVNFNLHTLTFPALACIILAGSRDKSLLVYAYQTRGKQELNARRDKLFMLINNPTKPKSFASLQTLCVQSIHQHLFQKVTKGKSIIPRLLKLTDSLPKPLARMLTFAELLDPEPDVPQFVKYILNGQDKELPADDVIKSRSPTVESSVEHINKEITGLPLEDSGTLVQATGNKINISGKIIGGSICSSCAVRPAADKNSLPGKDSLHVNGIMDNAVSSVLADGHAEVPIFNNARDGMMVVDDGNVSPDIIVYISD